MIDKYIKNGKNVKFDLTYNLIREMTDLERQFAVGVFVTLNNNLNIEPVCFIITNNESKESFITIFQ